jgi:NAD(P)-dependent dehydrogenase (short-subunit alcohol dehydrogenase family)
MTELTGQTAIVTGASRGIGAETAILLAEAGASVVLAARSVPEIEALARRIAEAGGAARAVPCDVADRAAVAALIAETEAVFGPVDLLVNNAGVIAPIAPLAEGDPEAWTRALDTNLKGVYWTTRAVLPAMIGRRRGTIVNVGSGAAHRPLEGWSHYCTAKAGALMLTRATDLEARAHGVVALSLSPGTVATGMQREIRASGLNPVSQLDWSEHIPPDWPARAIRWLAGPAGMEFAGTEVSLRDPEIRRRAGIG